MCDFSQTTRTFAPLENLFELFELYILKCTMVVQKMSKKFKNAQYLVRKFGYSAVDVFSWCMV